VTRINVRALADSLTEAGVTDATFKATATAARVNGADITFPRPIRVAIVAGSPLPTIELEEPDGTWAWELSIAPKNAPSSVIVAGLFTFAGDVVMWSELTPVDPDSLTPLDPVPPSALEVLLEAGQARDDARAAAELAGDDRAAAALYASSSARSAADSNDAAVAAGLSSVAAGRSRDEAVDVANGSVVSAQVEGDDLMVTTKAGAKRNAGNVRGLPGSTVPYGGNIGTADLNTFTSAGVYRQASSAEALLARNYPYAGHGGVLEVLPMNDVNTLLQRFTVMQGQVFTRGTYLRRRSAGAWDPWRFIPSQRIDKTAGIAVYTWDDISGREQLVHGDTGDRNVGPALIKNGWAGGLIIRRVGSLVECQINNLDGAAATSVEAFTLPIGFGPPAYFSPVVQAINGPFASTGMYIRNNDRTFRLPTTSPILGAGGVRATMSWLTRDPWPTELPGTAVGVIPNL
jgi:hypothetical protein